MVEDQLDDLDLNEPITLRILNEIAATSSNRSDGGDGKPRLNLETLSPQSSRKSGEWRKKNNKWTLGNGY